MEQNRIAMNTNTKKIIDYEAQFVEKVWRLPDVWVLYTPPENSAQIVELPALQNGFITFGCFHNSAKVSHKTLKLWADVLRKIPSAKFIWCRGELKELSLAEKFRKELLQNGVADSQISFIANTTSEEYWNTYNQVDFVLDTTPVCGGTTTCDALYMGVPTLTLAGDLMSGRLSTSILHTVGLDGWICNSDAEYIEKAILFAEKSQWNNLAEIRKNLRQNLLASPLCDSPRFAKNFETAMWQIWEKFINETPEKIKE